MRKRIIHPTAGPHQASSEDWLDLDALAEVELTSEDPEYPIESALLPNGGSGWRASCPGEQTIRLLFAAPQRIRRIWLQFDNSLTERTQEFVLRSSDDGGKSFAEIVRQQWNFSRDGSASETEDYRVDLHDVSVLELTITPDIDGGDAGASLTRMRVG